MERDDTSVCNGLREDTMTKPMRETSRATPHKLQAFGLESGQRGSHARVSQVQQHRGEHCPWSGRPHLRGMCREKWLKKWADVTNGPPFFRMVYPEKGSRVVTSPLFSPIKMCENCDLEPQRHSSTTTTEHNRAQQNTTEHNRTQHYHDHYHDHDHYHYHLVKIALSRSSYRRVPRHTSTRAPHLCRPDSSWKIISVVSE